ncbi:hypothetical protein FB45DRAFT_1068973 [Roridomyces roridus]|uniref:Uncharacterized protein n=1 Tax=Roridomyces roridus TaxID=1738132 RepID=A0AAD7B0D3_9AGAR|nr:hypothetical protein FB45DRAFT_1068973 [Roridomyces roridus]
MGRAIPDEIIHEILSPALSVSDDAFSAHMPLWEYRACRGRRVESSSAILLVCKAWLRVATPLLYHTIILGSKGQAQALSVALRRNPELGRLIRKLRLQSGYGSSLHQILQTTTKLTDIFIPLEFDEGDDACGLCRGIPLIDPVRVIITYAPFKATTAGVRTLVGVLVKYIPKWKNLAIFEMPHDWPHNKAAHNKTFSSPLKVAPSLRTLVLSSNGRDLFREGIIPQYISAIVQNGSLQEIRPKRRSRKIPKLGFLETVQGNARLRNLIDPNLFGPKKGFVYPPQLAGNPTVADIVWDRVLHYVFCEDDDVDDLHDDGDKSDYDSDDEDFEAPELWEPLRVCKQFQRLGTPYFYNKIYIRTCKTMRLFTRRLLLEPSLGVHVHRLVLSSHDDQTIDDLQNVFSRVPRLKQLSSEDTLVLPWHMFEDLSIRYGSHLDSFDGIMVTQCPGKADPIIFDRLSGIQDFTWKSDTQFDTTDTFAASDVFIKLEHLNVPQAHPSFFILLSQMQLPSLITVTLHTGKVDTQIFLERHGAKLSELCLESAALCPDLFDFCPNVKYPVVCTASKDQLSLLEGLLGRCDRHCVLENIVIDPKGFEAESELLDLLEVFLTKFDCTQFPALREITLVRLDWPLPNTLLPDSPWVKLAEGFRANNIHLVDCHGRWRPRREFVPEGD